MSEPINYDEWRAALEQIEAPTGREPGWYKVQEMREALNIGQDRLRKAIRIGIKAGTVEFRSIREVNAVGIMGRTYVYRFKALSKKGKK